MKEYIIMMLVVAAFMTILAYIFITGSIRAKKENRNVKFAFGVLGSVIMIPSICFLLYCGLFSASSLEWALFAFPFLTIPMSWLAMCFVKGIRNKVATFFIPAIPLCVAVIMIAAAMGGAESPLDKSDVDYTSQEEVEDLLGVGTLPKLKFERAARVPDGKKVVLLLEDPADSTRLDEVYERLCQIRSIQCEDKEYIGRMYHIVDNKDESYTNVHLGKDGIAIVYGGIWQRGATNDHFFDSIQAPIPQYEYVAYFVESCGPDWYHEQRIRFKQPLSDAWLKKVEKAAKTDSAWGYKEDEDFIYIDFDNSSRYTNMKIYKNLEGQRTIADVSWGDY